MVSLGLIGSGKWGKNYIKTLKKIDDVHLGFVVNRTIPKENFNLRNCKFLSNYEDLLDNKIDGVIISTPPSTHFEICKFFINRRVPILVEKPITLSYIDAKKLSELAKLNNTIVKVDHIHTYSCGFRKIKSIYNQNENLISLNSIGGGYGPFRKDINSMWDWGVHDLAMCLDLLGTYPLEINSIILNENYINGIKSNNYYINLKFQKNIIAYLKIGNLFRKKRRIFRINYKDESYVLDSIKNGYIENINFNSNSKKLSRNKIIYANDSPPLETVVKEFIEDVENKKVSYYDLDLSIRTINLLEQISALTRK